MGVSKNSGTPRSSILIRFSIIFTIHLPNQPWKCRFSYTIVSIYGIFTYISHKNQPNVGEYTIRYMDSMGYTIPIFMVPGSQGNSHSTLRLFDRLWHWMKRWRRRSVLSFRLRSDFPPGGFDQHLGVSKNRGTPKWMVKIMENPIKMDDLGKKHYFRKHPYLTYRLLGGILLS